MFATSWTGFHKFLQVIMLDEYMFLNHYIFKENTFFIMSQKRTKN